MVTTVLNYFGKAIAVIICDTEEQLKAKVETAIKEEVEPDEDTQFELTIGRVGDYGETTEVRVSYVEGGELIQGCDYFDLVKVVNY